MKEIIIIETQNGEKIKKLLEKEQENYKVYYKNEDDYWRQAVQAASQDQQRKKEIATWDKIASKVKDQ